MHPAHVNLSYRETVNNTYLVDIETQKADDLIRSLSNCYRSYDKEARLADALAKAIRGYLLNREDDLLHEALRQFSEARPNE